MRVLVVSAHYPPNFVSGGTLAPQRIAAGLAARGHDVSVYAGWLGDDRAPLEAWDDVDTVPPVRWIVVQPWIDWSSTRNYDNPEVEADFAAHLARVRPDVVHFHSVQALGAGVVEAAAATEAKVVLTMHDFWWFCARQFLVTRDDQPCCLVVDAGVCPCQVDRAWIERRNAWLRGVLGGVDLVLTPSASAARVVAANGVDPVRLAVDENGLPAALAHRRPVVYGADGRLRMVYVGGWNRMKGAHVLVDAAQLLRDRAGWHLTAYDLEPYLRDSGASLGGLPVDVRPPFAPDTIDDVYAACDVLVLPSVMRESHSLATREALSRGVPVICTDTLGPEEVVVNEGNGLIVPAADPEALADAVRRLLDDPTLLARLRAGCGDVPIRAIDDQVAGLEQTYAGLLEHAPPASVRSELSLSKPIQRVVFMCGIEGAPLRYRARLPAEALALLGVHTDVRHYRDPELPDLIAKADALVVYRVPATGQVLDLILSARSAGLPTFFDVDDLIFDPEIADEIPALKILPPGEADLWMKGVRRYRTTMEACDVFIGSTNALCRHATEATGLPAERFANGVGIELGRLSDAARTRPRRTGPLRVGYLSGTTTHDHDWRYIEGAVVAALQAIPEAELWLVGHVQPSAALDVLGDRVRRLPPRPWTDLPELLRDLDVNLAPLEPGSRFNEAKSAIKWLEAAIVGTPTIASPTEPFREAISPGVNGVLATTPDTWERALNELLADSALRTRLGNHAARDALLQWSPHLQARRYYDALLRGATRDRAARGSRWVPVIDDEPPAPVTLEPYPGAVRAPHGVNITPALSAKLRHLAGRVRRKWRRDGTLAIARRAGGELRQRLRRR